MTEFITGGGIANDPLPESLKQEGQLMLQAVLNDCLKMKNVQLVTTRDARIKIDVDEVEVYVVENAIDYMQQLALIANQCDATWVIAPESEGVLEAIIANLTNEKIRLVNCDTESIRITSDKLMCALHLLEFDIPTVKNLSQEEVSSYEGPVMIKDRYGVGCEGLKRCAKGKDALQYIDNFSQWVVQPYVEGKHLSLSILFSSSQVTVMSLNEQIFSGDDQPKLTACLVNAYSINTKIQRLADKIQQALPGLKGYVGIDVIEREGEYYVVDINPRLTSSYVGLSAVLDDNPAQLCFNSALDEKIPHDIKKNDHVIEVRVA